MRKNTKAGTGPYDDRQAITKSARQRPPREERRVTCRDCNGAGEVGTGMYRHPCATCNGAGQVFA